MEILRHQALQLLLEQPCLMLHDSRLHAAARPKSFEATGSWCVSSLSSSSAAQLFTELVSVLEDKLPTSGLSPLY